MTVEQAKKIIESNDDFHYIYAQSGEDYGYALDVWMEDNYYLVGINNEQDADELIEELNELHYLD